MQAPNSQMIMQSQSVTELGSKHWFSKSQKKCFLLLDNPFSLAGPHVISNVLYHILSYQTYHTFHILMNHIKTL